MHKNAIKKTGGSFFDTKVGIFYKNVAILRNILEWRFVAIFDSRGGDFVLKLSGHTECLDSTGTGKATVHTITTMNELHTNTYLHLT